jgi:hypothetical protein
VRYSLFEGKVSSDDAENGFYVILAEKGYFLTTFRVRFLVRELPQQLGWPSSQMARLAIFKDF